MDFIVEGGDGLAVFGDPLAECEVFCLDLASSLLSFVDALAQVFIFLAKSFVDFDVVTHIQDVQLLHDGLLFILVAMDLFLDFYVFLTGLSGRFLQMS